MRGGLGMATNVTGAAPATKQWFTNLGKKSGGSPPGSGPNKKGRSAPPGGKVGG